MRSLMIVITPWVEWLFFFSFLFYFFFSFLIFFSRTSIVNVVKLHSLKNVKTENLVKSSVSYSTTKSLILPLPTQNALPCSLHVLAIK